jgi:AmpD protein
MEGADLIPYTEAQYQGLAEVSKVLLETYPLINADRIVGHSDIAPGRKTDPGPAFQWDHYKQLLG